MCVGPIKVNTLYVCVGTRVYRPAFSLRSICRYVCASGVQSSTQSCVHSSIDLIVNVFNKHVSDISQCTFDTVVFSSLLYLDCSRTDGRLYQRHYRLELCRQVQRVSLACVERLTQSQSVWSPVGYQTRDEVLYTVSCYLHEMQLLCTNSFCYIGVIIFVMLYQPRESLLWTCEYESVGEILYLLPIVCVRETVCMYVADAAVLL